MGKLGSRTSQGVGVAGLAVTVIGAIALGGLPLWARWATGGVAGVLLVYIAWAAIDVRVRPRKLKDLLDEGRLLRQSILDISGEAGFGFLPHEPRLEWRERVSAEIARRYGEVERVAFDESQALPAWGDYAMSRPGCNENIKAIERDLSALVQVLKRHE